MPTIVILERREPNSRLLDPPTRSADPVTYLNRPI
jgi:hypothetical protein